MRHRHVFFAMVAGALVAASDGAAQGSPVGDADAGRTIYDTFCATCHGPNARGTGPTAELMTVKPPDLTQLAARSGTDALNLEQVIRRIDGRDPVLAHGSPMPVFGPFFEGEDVALKTTSGQPIMTSRPVADLVAWLRTIQSK